MSVTPSKNLEPLGPVVGRWRTSGTVVDADGNVTMTIAGTDVYEVLPVATGSPTRSTSEWAMSTRSCTS